MQPVVSTAVDYVQVPRTVTTPVTTMRSVTVSTPTTVMENVVAQRQRVVMQKRVVNRNVVVQVTGRLVECAAAAASDGGEDALHRCTTKR